MTKNLKRLRGITAALVIAVAATLGGSTAAQAYNVTGWWNVKSDPLYKAYSGSKAWAAGSAYIKNSTDGTRIYNTGSNKFTDADNHRPYVEGVSEWNAGTCRALTTTVTYNGVGVAASKPCARTFYDGNKFDRANGVTYTTQTWTALPSRSAKPNSGSDRGRVKVKLCIDVPIHFDSCTGYSYSPADSY